MGASNLIDSIATPAPRPGTTGQALDSELAAKFARAQDTERSYLRVVAVIVGITGLVYFLWAWGFARRLITGELHLNPWETAGAATLLLTYLGILASVGVHRVRVYTTVLRSAAVIVLAMTAVDMAFNALSDFDPLHELYLTDHIGIPLAALTATVHLSTAGVVTLVSVVLTTVFGNSDSHDDVWRFLVSVAHSLILLGPYLYTIGRMRRFANHIDAAAQEEYRAATIAARSELLAELQTRFVSHIHDQVLAQLNSFARGKANREQLLAAVELPEQVNSSTYPAQKLVAALKNIAQDHGAQFRAPPDLGKEITVPADVVAAIIDASVEALGNSIRHAPHAARSLSVTVADHTATVRVRDNGPGFDLTAIPPDRAGVRMTILDRPRAITGLDSQIVSRQGHGTEVTLTYAASPDASIADHVPSGSTLPQLNLLDGLGYRHIYNYRTAVVAWLVFLGIATLNDHTGAYPYLVACLTFAALALFWLSRVDSLQLDAWRTLGVSACVIAMVLVGQFAPFPALPDWPGRWYIFPAILLCAWLALRLRVAAAWGTWAVVCVASLLFTQADFGTYADPSVALVNQFPLLVPSSFLPLLTRRMRKVLPFLQRVSRDNLVTAGTALARAGYLHQTTDWLRGQLSAVGGSGDTTTAALLEKRLRDAIRSPQFDIPAITAAVWASRARGVDVRLIDDRTPSPAHPPQHEELVGVLLGPSISQAPETR